MGVAERRLREKEARRVAIMDAAEHVFFSHGVEGAKMDDVAERAELSKGLLYFYFRSKHDLAHAVAHRGLAVLEDMLSQELRAHERGIDQVRAMGGAYVRFAREYTDYFNLMSWVQAQPPEEWEPGSHGEACEQKGDKCIEVVAAGVQNGLNDGTIRAGLDPLATAVSLWAQTHGVISIISFKEVKGRYQIDPDYLLKHSLDLIEIGMVADGVRAEREAAAAATLPNRKS